MPRKKIKKIGILGGGQLARMMALKAHSLGLRPFILSESKDDPSAGVTRFWTQGNLDSLKDLKKFLKKTDLVTFENEFVNTKLLAKAMSEAKTPVLPHPQVIQKIQDRWTQKKLLSRHKIPTSPFVKIDNKAQLFKAFHQFNQKIVLKKRRFGYDGGGTFIIKNKKDLKKIMPLVQKDVFIGEEYIPFQKEWAVILAVHKNADPVSLPLVETVQKNFRCYLVKGPVKDSRADKFITQLKTFVKKIKYDGVIAFELFLKSGEIFVNEIAPRVHNSGHYSLDALSKDQFTLHLEAVLKQPLGSPRLLYNNFAMLNLLGKTENTSAWKKIPDVFLHDYDKKEKRKGRKMGHLNAGARSSQEALFRLMKAKKYFA